MTTVAVDYTPAIRQSAGIGRIVRGQVSTFLAQNPTWDIRLLVVGRLTENQRAAAPAHLHGTTLDERNMVRLWHRLGSPLPPVEYYTGGPLDLFHATDFVLAPNHARRTALTIHDLAFLHYPDASQPSLYRYLNVVVPRSIRAADHIIADSYHTARDVQAIFGIAAERISVVQGAVDFDRFHPVTDFDMLAGVRTKYGIGVRPYLFSLSSLQPRKNFVRLIEAFALAREQLGSDHILVIGGAKGWLYDEIFAKVEELNLDDAVNFVGFVADEDLPALYSGADLFAYPSLYEGFGLPILEALACRTPVLAGRNSCLAEAGGPGAIYVDAEDVNDIAAGLMRLLGDASLAAQMTAAGLIHVSHFTWERSAAQLKTAYERTLAS